MASSDTTNSAHLLALAKWFENWENYFVTSNSQTSILQYLNEAHNNLLFIQSVEGAYSVHLNNVQNTLERLRGKVQETRPSTVLPTQQPPSPLLSSIQTQHRANNRGGVVEEDEMVMQKKKGVLQRLKAETNSQGLCQLAGYDDLKQELKSIVILPMRQPQLFQHRDTYKSVLLFGPPGTGKTLFAESLAAEANADFYFVTAGSFMSPYYGETEKQICNFFAELKGVQRTTVVFFDEIDGLCRARDNQENDATRRTKSELLARLSAFEETNKHTFLICATNCPWDMDVAFLRRFQKRVYVPLPNRRERLQILQHYAKQFQLDEELVNSEQLLELTDNYSCSDLKELIRCGCNKPLIELYKVKMWKWIDEKYYVPLMECDAHLISKQKLRMSSIDELPDNSVYSRDVHIGDLIEATNDIKSTVNQALIGRYENYIHSS